MRRIAKAINRRDKRGTVLIFAIGALAVISVIAVSYVSVVRIERNSAAAVLNQNNRDQSVDIVVDKIREVIAADLFGNKVVTPSTPKRIGPGNQSVRVWPSMFEDGEFYDYPMVDELDTNLQTGSSSNSTHDTRFFRDPSTIPPVATGTDPWVLDVDQNTTDPLTGRRYETANPDDAWLATTEPEYHAPGIAPGAPIAWRNITNLRSTYRFVFEELGRRVTNANGQPGLWVRGDGRFADLGEFFNNADTNANDASALANFGDGGRDISVIDPEFGSVHHNSVGALNVGALGAPTSRTSVYQEQMDVMDGIVMTAAPSGLRSGAVIPRNQTSGDDVLDAKDERFWTDTDGDLRADARWQVLDELGNLANLRWVVATRIIDASSLINVNASLSFDAAFDTTNDALDRLSAGRTPADIDLYRFLERSRNGNAYYGFPDVTTGQLNAAWSQHHLPLGLGLTGDTGSIYEEIRTTDPDRGGASAPRPVPPLHREHQRHRHVRQPAHQPQLPLRLLRVRRLIPRAHGRGHRDHLPHAGPQGPDGLLGHERRLGRLQDRAAPRRAEPLPHGAGGLRHGRGPARPHALPRGPAHARDFEMDRPTVEELRASVRNAMTTISGVGDYSPVPVLNDGTSSPTPTATARSTCRRIAEQANRREAPPAGVPRTSAPAPCCEVRTSSRSSSRSSGRSPPSRRTSPTRAIWPRPTSPASTRALQQRQRPLRRLLDEPVSARSPNESSGWA